MIQDPKGTEVQSLFEAARFGGAQVLEIGCGDGRLTYRYAAKPDRIVGIEPTSALLISARDACPEEFKLRIDFVQATAPALPFPDDSFDIVVFAKSL